MAYTSSPPHAAYSCASASLPTQIDNSSPRVSIENGKSPLYIRQLSVTRPVSYLGPEETRLSISRPSR